MTSRRLELEQVLEAIVAVDDAAVQVVEVRRGEPAAFQRHERTQVGRDDRQHFEHHPFGTGARLREAQHEFQTLGQTLADLLALGVEHRFLQFLGDAGQFTVAQQGLDRLGPHAGAEVLAVLVLRLAVLGFVEELALLERGLAGVDDHVVLVVDDALQLPRAHVEHQAQAGGHALVEPDVRDGHGQFDVAHALAAHAAPRDFHAAAVADDALVLDALVLAARAFPVARGSEDALAEQAALFGLERAVVDRLRVFDLALAPGADRIGRSHGDADLVEADGAFFSEDFTKVCSFIGGAGGRWSAAGSLTGAAKKGID